MKFLKGIFTDNDGSPSSKRVILFLLIGTFLTVVLTNLWMGKELSGVLAEQLFYLIIYTLSTVFGEKVTGIFGKRKDPTPTDAGGPGGDRPHDPPIKP